jgi:hypothetical protein
MSPEPTAEKTCTKCGRKGTRSFIADGDGWVCASKWTYDGRAIEARLRAVEPVKAVCHKCGRVGVRGFVHDVAAPEPMTEAERAAAEVLCRIHNRRVDIAVELVPADFAAEARAVVAAVRPILAAEIEALAARLRAGFPDGPGDDTDSYIRGIETAAKLAREGTRDADPA